MDPCPAGGFGRAVGGRPAAESHYYVTRSSVTAMRARGFRRPNDPPVLILTSLAEGPKHGHALIKDIASFSGVTLGPGTLYGAITRLEEAGLIEPVGVEDRRRPYRITTAGARVLAQAVEEMRRIADVGAARLSISGGGLR